MPYRRVGLPVIHRRGLRGLGDVCNGPSIYSVVDQNGSGIPLASLSGVALQQFFSAVAQVTGGDFCSAYAGETVQVQVNTSGNADDMPAIATNYAPGSLAYSLTGTPQSVTPYKVHGSGTGGSLVAKAQQTFNAWLNPAAVASAVPGAGGVATASLPANFQVATPAPSAAALAQLSNAIATTGSAAPPSSSVPVSASSTIWIWLLGGAALLALYYMGGKS